MRRQHEQVMRLFKRFSVLLEKPAFRGSATAFVLTNTALLFLLVLTEQLRWLPAPWPQAVSRALFWVCLVTSAVYGVIIGTVSILFSVYTLRSRERRAKTDAMTLLRRIFVIPATYLLAVLWSWTWLTGHSPRFWGAFLVWLFVIHQIVLIAYYTTRGCRRAKVAKRSAITIFRFQLKIRRWWWLQTHRGYMKRLTPLNQALFEGAVRGVAHNVEVFLKRGADPNLRLLFGMPLVGLCAGLRRTDIVGLLLDAGADVNAAAPASGFDALLSASLNGDSALTRLLLERGANLETTTRSGATPLILAARSGHADVVRLLLAGGANIDAATEQGVTALIYAAMGCHAETVKTLLDAGADVTAKSRSGRTALGWARHKGCQDTVILLEALGNAESGGA